MHLGLFRREHLQSDDPRLIGQATADQFQRSHGALQAWAEAEHKDDGSHGAIHADSIVVGEGGITSEGDGIFGGDVIALDGSGRECGIGALNTVRDVPLLPGEILKTGLLIGGATTGHFVEHRPTASPPFDGDTSELCIWYLRDDPLVMPVVRLGLMGGIHTLIDGGSGKLLDLGNTLEPLRTVVAQLLLTQKLTVVNASLTYDVTANQMESSHHLSPTIDGAVDLGTPTISGGKRWRDGRFTGIVSASQGSFTNGVFERLRPVAMGEWRNVPIVPSLFATWGGVPWTVPAGSSSYRYTLVGKTMVVSFAFVNTTVTAGASIGLFFETPPGVLLAPVGGPLMLSPYAINNGVQVVPFAYLQQQTPTQIAIIHLAGWNAAAGTTSVYGQVTLEIQ